MDCACEVLDCLAPKNSATPGCFCKMHVRIHRALSEGLQLTWHAREAAHDLMPCDVISFVSHYEHMRGDLAMMILCTLIKQPAAVAQLMSL